MALTPFRPGLAIWIGDACWEDMKFPAAGINPPGVASDPTRDTSTGCLLFGASNQNTIVVQAQLPHSWAVGSALNPHVHWRKTTAAAGAVLWQLEYKWAPINGLEDVSWTVLSSATPVAGTPDNNTLKHLITAFADIATAGRVVSDMLLLKLSRLPTDPADTYAADALLYEFDIHYQIDSVGSDQRFAKT